MIDVAGLNGWPDESKVERKATTDQMEDMPWRVERHQGEQGLIKREALGYSLDHPRQEQRNQHRPAYDTPAPGLGKRGGSPQSAHPKDKMDEVMEGKI